MSRAPNFSKLLDEAKALGNDRDYFIERDVDQIDDTSRKLLEKPSLVIQTPEAIKKASILLATRGFDVEKLNRDLNEFDNKTSFQPVVSLSELDIEGYLEHEHKQVLFSAVDEVKHDVAEAYSKAYRDGVYGDWINTRREIMEQMAYKTGRQSVQDSSSNLLQLTYHTQQQQQQQLQQQSQKTPFITLPPSQRPKTTMSAKMAQYAVAVRNLNIARRGMGVLTTDTNFQFPLTKSFLDATKNIEADELVRKSELNDCWELVQRILGEESGLLEGCYTKGYANNDPNLRRKFLKGAKSFLSSQFESVMGRVVASDPERANRGGNPSLQGTIKGYMNIRARTSKGWPSYLEDIIDGFPLWPQIYYSIRCGNIQEAIKIAERAPSTGNLPMYLKDYMTNEDGVLSEGCWSAIVNDFRSISYGVGRTRDPYKIAVYNIIGRVELHQTKSFHEILLTAQDFIWLKLMLLTPESSPTLPPPQAAGNELKLSDVQKLILSFKPDHFTNNGKTPLLQFQVLVLTQHFERAIAFLHNTKYDIEAIHFAAVFYYYGVLNLPNISNTPQLTSPDIVPFGNRMTDALPASDPVSFEILLENSSNDLKPRLNFLRILMNYVAKFMISNPIEALEYYSLIKQENIRTSCMKRLVLETKDYEGLLGTTQPNGVFKPGILEEFMGKEKTEAVALAAATEAESSGRYDDAVKLYDIAEEYDKVLYVLNNRLSSLVVTTPINAYERTNLLGLARNISTRYKTKGILDAKTIGNKMRIANLDYTFELLLNIAFYFDLINAGKREEATRLMDDLALLPRSSETDDIFSRVEDFKHLDQGIKRIFPDLLLNAMELLTKDFEALTKTGFQDPRRQINPVIQSQVVSVRSRARGLVVMSSMLQYTVPADVSSRLLKMEVMMK